MLPSLLCIIVSAQLALSASLAQPAPANCKKLPIDADWPIDDVWKSELPGVEARRGRLDGNRTSPDYKYKANTVEQVQKAIKFTIEHNVRLSVLNSGHDFLGRSDAPSGLSLLVAGLKGVRVLESFTPTANGVESVNYTTKANTIKPDSKAQAAVTVGAGITIDEVNRVLAKSGLFAVGAAHGSVTVAGGWSQSGGHAALSSYYGLGSDQILEYKVVTADGKLLVANKVTNPDLFWALRGGGGGTFGVVVEATSKVYPIPKILRYSFWLNTTDYEDTTSMIPVVSYFMSQLPRLNKQGGVQGYYYARSNSIVGQLLSPNEFANATQMSALLDPVLDKMKNMPGIDPQTLVKIPPVDFSATLAGALQSSSGGGAVIAPASGKGASAAHVMRRHGPGEMEKEALLYPGRLDQDSVLIGEEELTHPGLTEALRKSRRKDETGQFRGHLVGGNKVFSSTEDTSVAPAWRRSYLHMMVTGNDEVYLDAIRALSPAGLQGAYINEASHKQPNWKHAFWGNNYPRLLSIKNKYDPDMLFYVSPGVGADQLIATEGRLCKVKDAVKAPESASSIPPASDNQNTMSYRNEAPFFPLMYAGKGRPPYSLLDSVLGGRAKSGGGSNGTVVGIPPPKISVPPVVITSSAAGMSPSSV